MPIYPNNTLLDVEETAPNRPEALSRPAQAEMSDETSLAHFCAFLDFYTRSCQDPFSTSLTCAKQAEAVQITPADVTPDTLRQMLTTMLNVVDHLEKKWLDEQIRHEDRMRRHREDVARLSQQLHTTQRQLAQKTPLVQRGIAWLHQMVGGPKTAPVRYVARHSRLKQREVFSA